MKYLQTTYICIAVAICVSMTCGAAAQQPITDTLTQRHTPAESDMPAESGMPTGRHMPAESLSPAMSDRYAGCIALSVGAGSRFVAGRLTSSHGKLIGGMLFVGAGTGLTVGAKRVHDAPTAYSLEGYHRERVVVLPLYAELRWHFPEIGRADIYMLSRIGADIGLRNADRIGVGGMLGAGVGTGRISIAVAYEHMLRHGMVTIAVLFDF